MSLIKRSTVSANGIEFTVLEAGSGPLALCLHGFPDTPQTWKHLLPALAAAGFRAVAPFMRGYAPTSIPPDDSYDLGTLVADVTALHRALGGDEDAVLVGHDWGAEAAYGAAAAEPSRWRRLVTIAVPPLGLDAEIFSDYDQLHRLSYLFFFKTPHADAVVAADEMAYLDRLWEDWSPGYDASDELRAVKQSLGSPANLAAALGYYRTDEPGLDPDEHEALLACPPQPTLYLHGAQDGCIDVRFGRRAAAHLSPGSQAHVVEGAGHFPQLERPDVVTGLIVDWLT